MIAIKDLEKIHEDVMGQFLDLWHLPEEHWKHSSECERNLNCLAEMLEQLRLLDYLVDLRLSLTQIAFLNDLSKKELKEAILFDGNGIGLDPEDLKARSRVRRQLRLFDETGDAGLWLGQIAFLNDRQRWDVSMTKRVYIWESVEPVMQEAFETFLRDFVEKYQDADDTESLVREQANSLALAVENGIRKGVRKSNGPLMKGDQT